MHTAATEFFGNGLESPATTGAQALIPACSTFGRVSYLESSLLGGRWKVCVRGEDAPTNASIPGGIF